MFEDPETGQLITISYNMIELPPWLRVPLGSYLKTWVFPKIGDPNIAP